MDGWNSSPEPQPAVPSAGLGSPRVPRPLTLGEILDGMFRLLATNWRAFLVALGVLVIPFNVVTGWLTSETIGGFGAWAQMFRNPMAATEPANPSAALGATYFIVQFLSVFVVTPLTWGVATHLAVWAYEGRPLGVREVWRAAMHRFWGMLGLMVLMWLIFFGGFALLGVGVAAAALTEAAVAAVVAIAALCLLAWIFVKISLAVPALVVEHAGPGTAIGRSWALVRGRFWRTFGTLILIVLILIVMSLVLIGGFSLVGAPLGVAGAIIAAIIGSFIVGMITTPLLINGLTLLYYDSRIRGEAYDLDVLSTQVGPPPGSGYGAPPAAGWTPPPAPGWAPPPESRPPTTEPEPPFG